MPLICSIAEISTRIKSYSEIVHKIEILLNVPTKVLLLIYNSLFHVNNFFKIKIQFNIVNVYPHIHHMTVVGQNLFQIGHFHELRESLGQTLYDQQPPSLFQ